MLRGFDVLTDRLYGPEAFKQNSKTKISYSVPHKQVQCGILLYSTESQLYSVTLFFTNCPIIPLHV